MSPAWMLQALLVGALLGVGALAAERVAGWFGVPRRAVWAAAMLGSLLLPALALWAPGLLPGLGLLPSPAAPRGADADFLQFLLARVPAGPVRVPAPEAAAPRVDLPLVMRTAWLAASLGMLGTIAWTYRRLRRLRARCVPVSVDGFEVRVAERTGPAVVGLVRPDVVVPRWVLEAPAEERRLILLHEREHVEGGDARLLFLATLAVAAMPWSLPLWWQHLRLRAAVETDCDARVLARGASRRAYGEVLIRTAGSTPGLPPLSPAWGETTFQLERRIMTMTAKRPSHRLLRSLPLLAVTTGVVAAACAVAGDPDPRPLVQATTGAPSRTVPGTDTVMVGPPDPSVGMPGYRIDPGLPVRLMDAGDPATAYAERYGTVRDLDTGSSAWRAGLREGDLVLTINGMDARRLAAMKMIMQEKPGTPYILRVRRGSEELEVRAEVGPARVRQARSR